MKWSYSPYYADENCYILKLADEEGFIGALTLSKENYKVARLICGAINSHEKLINIVENAYLYFAKNPPKDKSGELVFRQIAEVLILVKENR